MLPVPARLDGCRTGLWRRVAAVVSFLRPGPHIFFERPRKKPRRGPELRREHAYAATAPDLVDGVEQVDDVETNGHRLGVVRQQEFALDADIDLGVGRHRVDIGVTAAQAAAVDRVGAQLDSSPRRPVVAKCFRCGGDPAAELIDGARRGGHELVVIGIDKVRLKVRSSVKPPRSASGVVLLKNIGSTPGRSLSAGPQRRCRRPGGCHCCTWRGIRYLR